MTILATSARRRTPLLPYDIPATAPYNVPQPLVTPTYDGSGQAVHPDVVDFHDITPTGKWNGYRFWMAMTPYPYSASALENPSILVSQDGINWSVPPGLTNPLVDKPPTGWNADTELVYDFHSGQLACMFIRTNEGVRITRTDDGITWTPHASVDFPDWSGLSPSVLWDENVSAWRMWHNGGLHTRTAPALEGPWTVGPGTSGAPSPIWHSNVQRGPNGEFHLLAHTETNVNGVLLAASSMNGYTWVSNPTPLVTTAYHWSAASLYRPTHVLHEDGDRYRVWYCGKTIFGAYRIGYTEIPLTEWPTPP